MSNINHLVRELIGNLYLDGRFESENSDFVRDAFREIVSVNDELFDMIPYKVIYTEADVYQSAKQMREMVKETGEIYIYSGGCDHPFLSVEENLKGRAVHDVFAHMVCGCPFTFEGEYTAYLEQRKYYPQWTWQVLFAEIPAQTCAFYANGKSHNFKQRAIEAPIEWEMMCSHLELEDYTHNSVLKSLFERNVG